MDYHHHITKKRTDKHLNIEERFYIQQQLAAGDTIAHIARTLGRSRTTIYTELKRGTIEQIKRDRKVSTYCYDAGQYAYQRTHSKSRKPFKLAKVSKFIDWCIDLFKHQKWSLDAAVGFARKTGLFPREDIVCTKTLYNYLHAGMLAIKPIDCPLIVRLSTRKRKSRKWKKCLGQSIEERPESINAREEFGHWELDTVRGIKKHSDHVLVTLVERKTRFYIVLRSPSAKASDVTSTLVTWLHQLDAQGIRAAVCKTITSDNGSEFAEISTLASENLQIFFAHPYSAWERGTNERHNGLLRRIIPKGIAIKNVSDQVILGVTNFCNGLPRRIMDYLTPREAFEYELKKLFSNSSVQFHIAILDHFPSDDIFENNISPQTTVRTGVKMDIITN